MDFTSFEELVSDQERRISGEYAHRLLVAQLAHLTVAAIAVETRLHGCGEKSVEHAVERIAIKAAT